MSEYQERAVRSSPAALTGVRSGREDDRQSLHALSRMDSNPTDICRTRGPGQQNAAAVAASVPGEMAAILQLRP